VLPAKQIDQLAETGDVIERVGHAQRVRKRRLPGAVNWSGVRSCEGGLCAVETQPMLPLVLIATVSSAATHSGSPAVADAGLQDRRADSNADSNPIDNQSVHQDHHARSPA
jgi:hypothetical protein